MSVRGIFGGEQRRLGVRGPFSWRTARVPGLARPLLATAASQRLAADGGWWHSPLVSVVAIAAAILASAGVVVLAVLLRRSEARRGANGPDAQLLGGAPRAVTEEGRMEEDLRHSKRQLVEAQKVARVGSWEADLVRDELHWSDQVFEIFGLSREEFGQTEEAFFALVHPEDREPLREARERFIDGEGDLDERHRIVRPDGELRWVHERAILVRSPDGSPCRLVGTVQDVTRLKEAEDETVRLLIGLAQASRLEAIGRLSGGIAHDFNNMLTVILGHLDALHERLGPAGPLHSHVEAARDAAERSAELTRQLLAFARRQPVRPSVVDLNAAIEDTVPLLRRLIGEEIELEWRPRTGLPAIWIDPARVGQVLSNLCVNARDAIDGAGRIVVETSLGAAPAHGWASGAKDAVVLSVIDDGPGIASDVIEHVFEPFFTTKDPSEGTGLGLATVHGIVTQAGGIIEVSSEPGRGTRFDVSFPAREAERTEEPAADRSVKAVGVTVGATILVVEDEPAILALCKSILDGAGHRVLACRSAHEALECAARAERIDLLLTDVVMPHLSGPDLARILRERQPGLAVLYMSGYTFDVVVRRGVQEEPTRLLEKPFTPAELSLRVRQALFASVGRDRKAG